MNGSILANRSHEDRESKDFYPTPPAVTIALLKYLNLPLTTRIWEPACGEGHMCKTLFEQGYTQLIATDLYDRGYGAAGYDFLSARLPECDWIITNPPFSLSEEFIKKCSEHGKPFALLFKSQYWHAAGRRKLFEEYRPEAVLPLTWRPNFSFGARGNNPTMEVYWTVWGGKPAEYTLYCPLKKPVEAKIKKKIPKKKHACAGDILLFEK